MIFNELAANKKRDTVFFIILFLLSFYGTGIINAKNKGHFDDPYLKN